MLMSKEEKTGRTIVRCQRPNDRWKKITKVDRLVWGARIQESDMVILVYHRIKKKDYLALLQEEKASCLSTNRYMPKII